MILTEKLRFVCISCSKEHIKVRLKGSLDTCPKCIKNQRVKRWKAANPERKKALNQKWSEENREKDRALKTKWQKANPEYGRYTAMKYYTNKKQAIPRWADLEKIKEIYLNCPSGFHVDHIIPLQGRNVRGLHVENNLQYLLPLDNKVKSNKLLEGNP
jgi:hypothetical protein